MLALSNADRRLRCSLYMYCKHTDINVFFLRPMLIGVNTVHYNVRKLTYRKLKKTSTLFNIKFAQCSHADVIGLFVSHADRRLRCSLYYKYVYMLTLLFYLCRLLIGVYAVHYTYIINVFAC